MKRLDSLDWLPIEFAKRDLTLGSGQIVLLYRPISHGDSYINYITSNPDYAKANAEKDGYTEFALVVG